MHSFRDDYELDEEQQEIFLMKKKIKKIYISLIFHEIMKSHHKKNF